MLEASSLRSRKHSSSPTDTKNSNNILGKEKTASIMGNDSESSPSGSSEKVSGQGTNFNSTETESMGPGANSIEDSDVEMKETSPSQSQEQQFESEQKQQSRSQSHSTTNTPREKLSAEDLNGGLLDGALDDIDDDEDRDTEDTDGAHAEHEGEDGNGGDDEKERDSVDTHDELPTGDIDEASTQQSEDHDDGDGDVTMADPDDEAEDEATPATHTEDEEESEMPEEEEEGSHIEDEDEDEEGEVEDAEDEDEENIEDEEDEQPSKPEVKKDLASYSQKAILNRPQIIEEELKDSGDELSDLSEFDDTDDSDEDDADGSTSSNKAKVGSNSTATNASTNARPAPGGGGRKKSLRGSSRGPKEQEEKSTKGTDALETENQHPDDKESESEAVEEEEVAEEEGKADGDDAEEEDIEKKQKHMDALDALTTIEVEFASLRDKMYEERMLELDKEVEMINDGTHPELSTLMREIEEKREHRLRIAKAWRTHKGEIAQYEFEVKEYQAHCTFQSQKREKRNNITSEIGKNKRKLILELSQPPSSSTSSDNYMRTWIPDKLTLVRARKYRRTEANELRMIKERYGFPSSTRLRTINTSELEEDLGAMGLSKPVPQPNESSVGENGPLGQQQYRYQQQQQQQQQQYHQQQQLQQQQHQPQHQHQHQYHHQHQQAQLSYYQQHQHQQQQYPHQHQQYQQHQHHNTPHYGRSQGPMAAAPRPGSGIPSNTSSSAINSAAQRWNPSADYAPLGYSNETFQFSKRIIN